MRVVKWLNNIWFSDAEFSTLKIYRVVLSITLINWYLCILPTWSKFYHEDGVLQISKKLMATDKSNFFVLLDGFGELNYIIWIIGFAALFFLLFDKKPRLALIIVFIIQCSLVHRNRLSVNGEDLVYRMLLFHSCFFPWEEKLKDKSAFFKNWSVRFAQINLVLIYMISLPVKLTTDSIWYNGDLMYYVFANSTWSRWQLAKIVGQFPISDLMTWTAVLVEGLAPFVIWFKGFRFWTALTCLSFHVLIGILLHNVFFFSLSMACGFILFFPEKDSRMIIDLFNKYRQQFGNYLRTKILQT